MPPLTGRRPSVVPQLPERLDAYRRVTVDPERLESLQLAPGVQKTLFLVYVGDRAAAERQAALRQTGECARRQRSSCGGVGRWRTHMADGVSLIFAGLET